MKRQYKQSVKLNGGIAIPLGNNYFYMKGRKHSTGGIDVDKNLEVEDGEIVHAGKKSTKVYSSLPFLNGISPVEKLLGGQNPNKVFAEQERFKDKHGINDDGTLKKQLGGKEDNKITKAIDAGAKIGLNAFTNAAQKEMQAKQDFNQHAKFLYNTKDDMTVNERIAEAFKFAKENANIRSHGYIGGKTIEARKKFWESDKDIRQFTDSVAKSHNVDPHLLRASLSNEGIVDANIRERNMGHKDISTNDKNYVLGVTGKDFLNGTKLSDAYGLYGIDDSGTYYDKYKSMQNLIKKSGIDGEKRKLRYNEKDRIVHTIQGENNAENIITHSATLKTIQDIIANQKRYKNIPKDSLNDLTLYHFNFGPNADTPVNVAKMRKGRYNAKNYKAMGGEIKRRGLYSVTSNGQTKLYSFPSTGSETQNNRVVAQAGTEYNNKKELPPAFRHLGIIYNQYKKIKGEDKNENKSKSNNVNVDKRIKLDKFDFPELTYDSPYVNKYGINSNKRTTKTNPNQTKTNVTKVANKNVEYIVPKILGKAIITGNKVKSKTNVTDTKKNGTKKKQPTINNELYKEKKLLDLDKATLEELSKPRYNKLNPNTNININGKIQPLSFTPNARNIKPQKTPKSNWWNNKVKSWFKDSNNVADTIGLTSNFAGNLASAIINKKALDNMKYTDAPMPKVAAKLKTNYNINPALNSVREDLATYNRNVDYNTESSQVALNRKRQALANAMNTSNNLYAHKENEETKLINADKLNQQGVANENIDAYNNWMKEKTNFDNTVKEKRAENVVGFMNNFNLGIQDILTRRENRRKDLTDAGLILAASPHVNTELLERYGVNIFDNKSKNSIINPATNSTSSSKNRVFKTYMTMPRLSKFKPDYDKYLKPGAYANF